MVVKRKAVSLQRLKEAGVAKLVDALDLGSSAVRRGGSSPFVRTSRPRNQMITRPALFMHSALKVYFAPIRPYMHVMTANNPHIPYIQANMFFCQR